MIKPEILPMSSKELSRLDIIQRVSRKEMTQAQAASQLNLSVRQVRRLQKAFESEGAKAIVSKRRGKTSNNKLPASEVERVAKLVIERYPDFGPTLAHEKLIEEHQISMSVESLRSIMIDRCGWEPKSRKRRKVYQSRRRRSRFGELVQIDGSPHAWFEERGPECCLIVYVDDATGAFLSLKFYESETTQAYMESTKAHLKDYGRPVAYYSDRHSIFKPQKPGDEDTQFGRALKMLDIDLICAYSPQAKGRVERANQTFQDRLVKELRLRGISTIGEANEFLLDYRHILNDKFAKSPIDSRDAHRETIFDTRELDLILCPRATRKATKSLEISYKNKKLQLPKQRHRLKGAVITVCELYDADLVLLHDGSEIEYEVFELTSGPSVETDKTINNKVDNAIKRRKKSQWKPASDHPWRLSAQTMKEKRAFEKNACV